MKLSDMQMKVFLDRYALKDAEGKPIEKTPVEMWQRVANAIASAEPEDQRKFWATEFYNILHDFKFVPGGRILAGAGTGYQVTLNNCYVLPSPKDSREGITDSLRQWIEIMSTGGGVGINLSSLRPRGARVYTVNGTSSGAVSWGEIFSDATGLVIQGGTRRGAAMIMLEVWHADIEEFIRVKEDLSRYNNANLSVLLTNDFMQAVYEDKEWDLIFPDTTDPDYDTLWDGNIRKWRDELGKPVRVYKTVKARDLWNQIITSAWKSAEPGIFFIDNARAMSNSWYYQEGLLIATNPCAEQCLPAYAVCNLGAINLSKFAHWDGTFDWHDLRQTVKKAVRFLDNVIDCTYYPLPETERQQKSERRVGLGVMGLGHALIKLGVRYGSPESIEWIESIFREIRDAAYDSSIALAYEKGPFPKFDADKYLESGFTKTLPDDIRELIRKYGIRNVTLLTVAPTGTTSLLAGTSSGIEPVFAFKMKRTDRLGEHIITDPIYQEWIEMHGEDAELPDYFVEAYDVTPEEHVAVQAAAQKYVDAAISKTANMPEEATVDDVRRLYESAHKAGLKGLTVYRAGSRDAVLETLDKSKKDEEPKQSDEQKPELRAEIVAVPNRVTGITFRENTAVGTLRVVVNEVDGEPVEVLCLLGKGGMDVTSVCEAIGRIISMYLRTPSPMSNREKLEHVVEQLSGILGSNMSHGFGPNRVMSLPDAVAKALRRYLDGEGSVADKAAQWNLAVGAEPKAEERTYRVDLCPECGQATLVNQSGCYSCLSCGYAKCG